MSTVSSVISFQTLAIAFVVSVPSLRMIRQILTADFARKKLNRVLLRKSQRRGRTRRGHGQPGFHPAKVGLATNTMSAKTQAALAIICLPNFSLYFVMNYEYRSKRCQ
jgi:hypothetical protein